jgi:putative PIG3 family NAD(P)H quinone oxidoreductase
VQQPGGPDVLRVGNVPEPIAGNGDVLISVAAAGVNRADVLQRMGFYPPPPGASDIIGLEVAGEVLSAGAATRWRAGDRVMALIEGGGYAEIARAPAAQVMSLPDGMGMTDAAGIPEVFITAHDALFTRGALRAGQSVLVHGGAGGVGTAAVQLGRAAGCTVIVTAGSEQKLQRSQELGAAHAINYGSEDFVERVRDITQGCGVDVILDVMGAAYLQRNVDALADDGRIVVIGLQGGTQAELDLARLMRKRGSIISTALRARPAEQKAAIVAAFVAGGLPGIAAGSVRPIIDRVLSLEDAAAAHRALERGEVIGKIVLQVTAT